MQQPSATAAPYVVIDPILGRGSSMAAPTTVNIPNGHDLLLNASSKISDISPNTPWPHITMDSTDNKHKSISIQYLFIRDDINILNWGGCLIIKEYFFSTTQWIFGTVGEVWYGVISHPIGYTITNYA